MGEISVDDMTSFGEEEERHLPKNSAYEEKILVSVRLRPLSEKEIARNDVSDWECINDNTIIFKNNLPEKSLSLSAYKFDRVFSGDHSTKQVYDSGAKEVALSVVSGINASIFAYGQTNSGKTFTMTGITEYTMADIFEYIKRHEERKFVLKFSAVEIYNENVTDLLSPNRTPLRLLDDPERGTVIEKLNEETLRDWSHLQGLISICEAQRQIGESYLNEASSRSHQILRLTVESTCRHYTGNDSSSTLSASVNFVDLAGSERASLASLSSTRLKEGCHINRSLLTLGTVIRKLSMERNGHVPYRDSKLTRILQPSLGGNARTAIICTMSPARSNIEQSKYTLLFASCAKEVVTNAQVNIIMSDKALVKHLQREVSRLENQLRVIGSTNSMPLYEALLREKDIQIQKMEKEIRELTQQRDLVQSRLEDLLQGVGDNRNTSLWGEIPHSVISLESSKAYNSTCFGHCEQDSENQEENISFENDFSEVLSSTPALFDSIPGNRNPQHTGGDFDDTCKVVRCIKADRGTIDCEEFCGILDKSNNRKPETECVSGCTMNLEMTSPFEETNEIWHEDFIPNSLDHQEKDYAKEVSFPKESPWMMELNTPRHTQLTRSRSCKTTFSCVTSLNTPPSPGDEDHFIGRIQGITKIQSQLRYDSAVKTLLEEDTLTPKQIDSFHGFIKIPGEENTTNSFTAVSVLEDKINTPETIVNDKDSMSKQEHNFKSTLGVDVGLDPIESFPRSPTVSTEEFEKKKLEILDLWHYCNVSLIHRTYFFLLFNDDIADSIYLEVELRRLTFLKRTIYEGKPSNITPKIATNVSQYSSKSLKQERKMLSKQMKKLTAEERETLYNKWGIQLETKQRKLQMAYKLWMDPNDMVNVRDSAKLIKRLVGFSETEESLKEMFSLCFMPTQKLCRSLKLRHSLSLGNLM